MLRHPLLVEAIETEFVPVAIYNNKKGRDAEILERYEEPSWNNPVMRFLDARRGGDKGADILPRKDRIWAPADVARRFVEVLRAAKRSIPVWLVLTADELAKKRAVVTLPMHCFWDGEAKLGAARGVTKTTAGWVGSEEVVRVEYDPTLTDAAKLRALVDAETARDGEFRPAKDSDRKFALRRSPLRHLPMSAGQRARVNAALRLGHKPAKWLSPRQRSLAAKISALDEKRRAALAVLPPLRALDAFESKLRATGARSRDR